MESDRSKQSDGDTSDNSQPFFFFKDNDDKNVDDSISSVGFSPESWLKDKSLEEGYIMNGFVHETELDSKLKQAKSEVLKNINSKHVELQSMM